MIPPPQLKTPQIRFNTAFTTPSPIVLPLSYLIPDLILPILPSKGTPKANFYHTSQRNKSQFKFLQMQHTWWSSTIHPNIHPIYPIPASTKIADLNFSKRTIHDDTAQYIPITTPYPPQRHTASSSVASDDSYSRIYWTFTTDASPPDF